MHISQNNINRHNLAIGKNDTTTIEYTDNPILTPKEDSKFPRT